MNEFTKGPWTIETPCGFPYSGLYVVPVVRKDFPCYIAQIRQLREHEESEANACLIAAAPDLLKACGEYSKGVMLLREFDNEIILGAALQLKKADDLGLSAIAKATHKP